ncbi:alpha/beta hydrolase family protein [Prolixibacter bellariivorans]|nr:prolyl oligopeptidase family serine peptidase [Prolixibacter bellariivorans]
MKKLFLSMFLVWFAAGVFAQQEKKPLTFDNFNTWKHIRQPQISENGQYLVYELKPGHGDGSLIIKDMASNYIDTIARGYGAKLAGNSSIVTFKIKPPLALRREAEVKKFKKDKQPKDSIGIYSFKTHSLVKYPNAESFEIPEEGADWVAFLSDGKIESPADTTKTDQPKDTKKKKKEKKESGNLVVVKPGLTDTLVFRDVKSYSWSKNGQTLMFTAGKKDSTVNLASVNYFDTKTSQRRVVYSGEGFPGKIAVSEAGDRGAFLFSKDTVENKTYDLYLLANDAEPKLIADTVTATLPKDWAPSENGKMNFSKDGKRLFFGTAPKPEPEPEDSLMSSEKARLDIWAWTDKELQPRQKINLKKEKKRTYLAVYDIEKGNITQLADKDLKMVRTKRTGEGEYAYGVDPVPYERAMSWTGLDRDDYYLVNISTGEKKLLVKGIMRGWLGPDQRYFVYYNWQDSIYYSVNTKTMQALALTSQVNVLMCNELNDMPTPAGPYGVAGWAKDDKYVFVYDRYDIWRLDPSGKEQPANLTEGYGRKHQMKFRYVKLDPEEEYISTKTPVLLSVFQEKTKQAGYASLRMNKPATPNMLLLGDYTFRNTAKAKNAKQIIFTRESFTDYPDVWKTNDRFANYQKETEADPQQKDYLWGSAELVSWTNLDGVQLQGLLYKPENFDPSKKYPMMVYFYERSSDSFHRYWTPSPSRSIINKPFYTSNGYLVFVPDIVYTTGYPGQSAYDCIMSGVHALMEKYSFVDAKHMALQGQSWGGYQTAYLVTQTNLFAAAMAGAPVSNMTSAYGGIRWGSGLSRMFQYEHSQSRLGGTLWNKPWRYIENSPLFYADKVHTPLLMMHNDHDTAVPWYQGIEFFVALRRLNQPVWMLSYNDEPHNLKADSWGDRMDLSIRMKQFFDHYLKGAPEPRWMKSGRPAIDKDTDDAMEIR